MQTVTVEITHENALKALRALEGKRFIKIISESKKIFPALPGRPLTSEEFRNWIAEAEKGDTISLKDAKAAWAKQRKQLLKLVK